MKRQWIAPILMISLGLNLLLGYQNCGQVDPAFIYNTANDSDTASKVDVVEAQSIVESHKLTVKPYLHISKVKVLKSDVLRLQRSVAYDFTLEFRAKYTNHYIGIEPKISKAFEIKDSKQNIIAKIAPSEIEIFEKECIESIDTNQQTYFDCKYLIKVEKDLDVAVTNLTQQKYSVSNSKKGIEFIMVRNQKTIATKTFITAINYIDKYVPVQKSTHKKLQAQLPTPKNVVQRKSSSTKDKFVGSSQAVSKLPLKKKIIEPEVQIVEGVYCHIRVLNPPHLEILSDVKKVGTYYEDADTCREVAIKLSKAYCSHSLMGELDINWSLKDKRMEGEKVIEKSVESIECLGS